MVFYKFYCCFGTFLLQSKHQTCTEFYRPNWKKSALASLHVFGFPIVNCWNMTLYHGCKKSWPDWNCSHTRANRLFAGKVRVGEGCIGQRPFPGCTGSHYKANIRTIRLDDHFFLDGLSCCGLWYDLQICKLLKTLFENAPNLLFPKLAVAIRI